MDIKLRILNVIGSGKTRNRWCSRFGQEWVQNLCEKIMVLEEEMKAKAEWAEE